MPVVLILLFILIIDVLNSGVQQPNKETSPGLRCILPKESKKRNSKALSIKLKLRKTNIRRDHA